MNISLTSLAAMLGIGSALAASAGFPASPEDLRGMASLVCSGTLVRLGRSAEQPALLLTNGHCATNLPIEAGDAIVDAAYERGPIALFMGGEEPEAVTPKKIIYATRTGTDLALIELVATYQALEARGARVYEISDAGAKVGTEVQLVSGFWKEKLLCTVSHIVPELLEDAWTTVNSIALRDPCPSVGGWSGTPMVDPTSKKIVGILSTSNMTGGLCSLDNPCEVDTNGNRMAFAGRSYGQRTTPLLDCMTPTGHFDLSLERCKLTKPKPAVSAQSTESGSKSKKSGSLWPNSK
jgi:hypothetical protein